MVGFVGAELDDSVGRVWLHGPLVDYADWNTVADALLLTLFHEVPRVAAKDHELAGDVANTRLAELAERHGFAAGKVHHILTLPVAKLDQLSAPSVPPVRADQHESFLRLHDQLFPGTYYTGDQLLDQAATGEAAVLGLVSNGELVGYAAGRIDEAGAGYIDFLGVEPLRRRAGHGRTLVIAACKSLQAMQPIPHVQLTVSSENDAALALYDGLGFERTSSAVGYRRSSELDT